MFKNTLAAVQAIYKEFATSFLGFVLVTLAVLVVTAVCGAIFVGVVLGIYWLMWQVWMLVIPQVAGTMPQGFKYPSYTLFIGSILVLAWVRNFIRGFFRPFKAKTKEVE